MPARKPLEIFGVRIPDPIEEVKKSLRRAVLGPPSVPGTPRQHRNVFQRIARAILDVETPERNAKRQFRKAPVKRWWRRNL
jgi:hypothetical protein